MQKYTLLNWDSDFFGYPVAKIQGTQFSEKELPWIISEMKENQIRLAYLFFPKSLLSLKQVSTKLGGIEVDCKRTYLLNVNLVDMSDSTDEVRSYLHQNLTPELTNLVYESGQFSRYFLDINFGIEEYHKLYNEWIKKSLNGTIADDVLVVYRDSHIVGFVTIAYKEEEAKIGLIAVNKQYRGQAIGTKLMQTVIKSCRNKEINKLFVSTQEHNKPACQFYEKLGFIPHQVEYVYHFWL